LSVVAGAATSSRNVYRSVVTSVTARVVSAMVATAAVATVDTFICTTETISLGDGGWSLGLGIGSFEFGV
jgi:hypothetical protein